jgi:hypothetical protein
MTMEAEHRRIRFGGSAGPVERSGEGLASLDVNLAGGLGSAGCAVVSRLIPSCAAPY